MSITLVAIALGGAAGAVGRFVLSGWVYERLGAEFPWGTLSVNLSGSFVLGIAMPVLSSFELAPGWTALLTVGLLGSFTTFSTFAYEAELLLQERQRLRAAAYLAASVGLGLLAVAAGYLLSDHLILILTSN